MLARVPHASLVGLRCRVIWVDSVLVNLELADIVASLRIVAISGLIRARRAPDSQGSVTIVEVILHLLLPVLEHVGEAVSKHVLFASEAVLVDLFAPSRLAVGLRFELRFDGKGVALHGVVLIVLFVVLRCSWSLVVLVARARGCKHCRAVLSTQLDRIVLFLQ